MMLAKGLWVHNLNISNVLHTSYFVPGILCLALWHIGK